MTGSTFGLRARIATIGGDADETDNQATRQWAVTFPVQPGATARLRFSFSLPQGHDPITVNVETDLLPREASLELARASDSIAGAIHIYHREYDIVIPGDLPYGTAFPVRLTVAHARSHEALQHHERIAVYDTTPPMVTSYRAVMLRDGRIAVQVQVGDRYAGLSENAVITEYSQDNGQTWVSTIHRSTYDDFAKPALFEAIIDSPVPHGGLLIGVSVRDNIGNTTRELPADATVFVAPPNAEFLLDAPPGYHPDGNPIFAPEKLARQALWVRNHRARRTFSRDEHSNATDRFESRRLAQLDSLPAILRAEKVDVSRFLLYDAPLVRVSSRAGVEGLALRLGHWN
jgi:hypothetical protein